MAFESKVSNIGHLVAAASMASNQYLAVKQTSATQFNLCSTAGERALGILQDAPASGSAGEILTRGVGKAVYGDTVTAYQKLTPNSAGKLVPALEADFVVAIALQAGSADEVHTVEVCAVSGSQADHRLYTLADPGAGAAIPVLHSAYCGFTIGSAGEETNSLAIPSYVGQRLILNADTVGTGTRKVTASQALNQTGNTIMTFAAARDNCLLEAIKIGGALRWQIMANDGVALSGP